jgi:hypothetical protein
MRMRSRRLFLTLACLLFVAAGASAQPQLAVNGAAPPAAVTVAAGSPLSVSVSGGPGNATDWLGL